MEIRRSEKDRHRQRTVVQLKVSDIIAQRILRILEQAEGTAEIQRNELAGSIGCVPSQINYVLSSRFTQEQGYLVESRRGGGGYIRITRMKMDKGTAFMHIVNSIGDEVDAASARVILENMAYSQLISPQTAHVISAAMSPRCYRDVPAGVQERLRASLLKTMLLASTNP